MGSRDKIHQILDQTTHLLNHRLKNLTEPTNDMKAPKQQGGAKEEKKNEREGGRRSHHQSTPTAAATGGRVEKCIAARPVLPLRRNPPQNKSSSSVRASNPIAIENILVDLHKFKLRPVTVGNQTAFLANPAKSPTRSVHWSGDEAGGGDSKKVVSSRFNWCLYPEK